jgi:hypothetical protein
MCTTSYQNSSNFMLRHFDRASEFGNCNGSFGRAVAMRAITIRYEQRISWILGKLGSNDFSAQQMDGTWQVTFCVLL